MTLEQIVQDYEQRRKENLPIGRIEFQLVYCLHVLGLIHDDAAACLNPPKARLIPNE